MSAAVCVIGDGVLNGSPYGIESHHTAVGGNQILNALGVLIDHRTAALGCPACKAVMLTGKAVCGDVLSFIVGIRLSRHTACGVCGILIKLNGVLIRCPNRFIGKAFGRHNGYGSNLPACEGVTRAGHVLRSDNLCLVEHVLNDRLCAVIVRVEGQRMLHTTVVDLYNRLTATVNRRFFTDNALHGHILKDNGVWGKEFLVSGLFTVYNKASEILFGEFLACGSCVLNHML